MLLSYFDIFFLIYYCFQLFVWFLVPKNLIYFFLHLCWCPFFVGNKCLSYCGKYRTLNIFDCIRFQASNKMNPIRIRIKLILKLKKFIIIAIENMKNSNKLFQYLYFNRVSNVQFPLFLCFIFCLIETDSLCVYKVANQERTTYNLI